MYCDFFGFREHPFTITPNPRFLFFSKNHREAYAHLFYGITNHSGFMELTGEVGSGKTTVIRTLLDQLDSDDYRTALIVNPCLSGQELMRSINREYGIPYEGLSSSELLQELNRFLLAENTAGRTVVLVIDEAQNLEPRVLEQIRLISNLETVTDKLIQIVLVGQPELGALLERTELRQLSQRIAVRYHLNPMDAVDTTSYIEHRLETAGGRFAVTIFPAALAKIYRFSGGLPRLINVVCDRSLLVAYGESKRVISDRTVGLAIQEIRRQSESPGSVWKVRAALAVLLVAVVLFGVYLYSLRGVGTGTAQEMQLPLPVKPPVPVTVKPPVSSRAGTGVAEPSSEMESARNAVASIDRLWGGDGAMDAGAHSAAGNLRAYARVVGLEVTSLKMGLGALRNLDVPVVLEARPTGMQGKRYLVVTGTGRGLVTLAAPFRGSTSLPERELRRVWRGNVHVVWKNFRDIPLRIVPGASGPAVSQVRLMLEKAGCLRRGAGTSFDGRVRAALKEFQRMHGLREDGLMGVQTLLLLYRHGGGYPVPRLAAGVGG
jgi:general secretion pathway protein A